MNSTNTLLRHSKANHFLRLIFAAAFATTGLVGLSHGQLVTRTIDFEFDSDGLAIAAGTQITDQYSDWGVTFSYTPSFRNGSQRSQDDLQLWTFDTANPTGGDDDLSSPGSGPGNSASDWANNDYVFGDSSGAGNVLIIQEPPLTDPDDNGLGGVITIEFTEAVRFRGLGILDIDDSSGTSYIRGYQDDGDIVEIEIDELGDNSYQEIFFGRRDSDWRDITKVEIDFYGSGSISGFKFKGPETPIPEPSTYGMIGAALLGAMIIRRKISKNKKAN